MDFCDFLGNESLKAAFLESLQKGAFAQSYLIEGAAGSGKRTFARLMAKSLLCRSLGADGPCGRCVSCRKAEGGIHPDITVVIPEKDKTTLSVEAVRSIREGLYILPNDSDRKIYIIPDAENLTPAAQNALLKAFEEPPPFVLFILTAKSPHGLVPTLLSRAARLKTAPVANGEMAAYIRKRHKSPEAEIEAAVALSGGSVGLAESLLKGKFLEETLSFLEGYARALAETDRAKYLLWGAFLEKDKAKAPMILGLTQLWFRDILVWKEGAGEGSLFFAPRAEEIKELAGLFTKEQLASLWKITQKAADTLSTNANFSSALAVMQIDSWEEIH